MHVCVLDVKELASSLFMFVLEVIPAELLPNLRPFISELFALHNHRGSLSLFLHPLLEKLLLEFIEVPTAYPCNLARSVSHLPATPAFVISNVMRSSPAVASLAELLEQMLSQGSIDGTAPTAHTAHTAHTARHTCNAF
jgi:hypothetical protein